MVTITLPPELESVVMKRAQHKGTTPELFLLEDLWMRYLPEILPQSPLAAEPQKEGIAAGEYPIWSPHDAHDAAASLLNLLEQDKQERADAA